jgi:hypothetical protein
MKPTWIKIRDDIDTDPKVLRIATLLAPHLGRYVFQEKAEDLLGVTPTLTCNALRDVACNALRRVWSAVARHACNGIITDCEPELIDQLAGIPGMFRAMAAVQWVHYDAATRTLTLTNWDEFNARRAKPKDGQTPAQSSTERSRRYRERLAAQGQNKAPAAAPTAPPCNGNGNALQRVATGNGNGNNAQIEIEIENLSLHYTTRPEMAEVLTFAKTHTVSDVTGTPITPEIAQAWYDARLKIGWQTPVGDSLRDIEDWRADLRSYARQWKKLEGKFSRPGGPQQPRNPALQRNITDGLSAKDISTL